MFSGLIVWVLILIVVGIIVLIGGVVLPVLVPMMIDYTQSNQAIVSSGTPFFQFLVSWWPLVLPAIMALAIIVLVTAKGKVP